MEAELDFESEDDEDDDAEVDELLDAMMEAADLDEGENDDLSERRRRRRRRRGRSHRRRGVPRALGLSAYRMPLSKRYVNQKQLKDALARVGKDVRRNALGIKTVNTRVGRLNGRVSGVVSVNRVQSRNIGRLKKQMQLAAALDLAESYGPGGLDVYQIYKGLVKYGAFGDTKGFMGNPLAVGGIGFVLNQLSYDSLAGLLGGGDKK